MGSVSRRLAKATKSARRGIAAAIAKRKHGMSVSDAAAIIAPHLVEGMLLSERLENAARDVGATDPLDYLEYLRRMRRGYDPKKDGPSKLMRLVDEIAIFEREELARRKAEAEAVRQ